MAGNAHIACSKWRFTKKPINRTSKRGTEMKTIKARYSKGVIKPLEDVEIGEGEEITIRIIEVPSRKKKKSFLEALKVTAGGWKNLINCDELKRNIYNDRLITTRPEVKL